MNDGTQSARSTLERQQQAQRIAQLEADNERLRRTVVGLGALVADATAQGYIAAAAPRQEPPSIPPGHGPVVGYQNG